MRRARVVVALALVAGLVVLVGPPPPVGAAGPSFPPGDDQIAYSMTFTSATCGATTISTGTRTVTATNVPAGAQVYTRYYDRGVRYYEPGPFAPAVFGTGSTTYGALTFRDGSYPRMVGIVARIDVGGEPTYLGGTTAVCAGPGATPVITQIEDFFPPCGVGDHPVFPDVPAASPFCADVDWVRDSGVTTGYPDGGYHPAAPVTRQAMAAFLFRSAGSPGIALCTGPAFPDVPTSHPFCGEIAWLAAEGIATGYADGGYHPAAVVSRQAMAAFLYRFAGRPDGAHPSCATPPFPDVPASHPFCGEIAWLAAVGIADGYADGGFHPASAVSRQAMAAFLHRLIVWSNAP